MLKDILGTETTVGDHIAYSVQTKGSDSLRVGRIDKIIISKDFYRDCQRIKARVSSRQNRYLNGYNTISTTLDFACIMPLDKTQHSYNRKFFKLTPTQVEELKKQGAIG